jgi:UDP-glucose 4-epimerase
MSAGVHGYMSQTKSTRANPKKTVVVTGGAGFIGSRLCKRLADEGHRVISLDNYFTGSKDNHVAGVDYRTGHTKDIDKYIHETPDLIYHLGEYSRVEISLTEPALVWDLNKNGTFGVLEFCRKHNVKLVYAGSSTKFGDGGLSRDQSPYAWTKATNTELVRDYGTWYGLPYAIAYFYNVYGPGERSGKYGTVIEIFRQRFLSGDPLTVVSPGSQKRNFTHVDDIVEGLLLIGEKGDGDNYGLGDDREYSILEIANMFGGNIEMLPGREGNRMNSTLETAKSKKLGWVVRHRLEDYVKGVIG